MMLDTEGSIFVAVFRLDVRDIAKALYWLHFLKARCVLQQATSKPSLLLVGSNYDVAEGQSQTHEADLFARNVLKEVIYALLKQSSG